MPVSGATRTEVFKPETGTGWFVLITIEPGPDTPTAESFTAIRLVGSTQDVVSRTNTYTAISMELRLPIDSVGRVQTVRLRVDNATQQIITSLRALTAAPKVTLEVVSSDNPDTVDRVEPFLWRRVQWAGARLEGELRPTSELQQEPWPQHRFVPSLFPAGFKFVA